jgi:hypothetical protein
MRSRKGCNVARKTGIIGAKNWNSVAANFALKTGITLSQKQIKRPQQQ